MQKKSILIILLLAQIGVLQAQKRNYIGIEGGFYFGNANANLKKGFERSGMEVARFDIEIPFLTWGPEKTSYRVRAGHFLNEEKAIELGFGRAYYGNVNGYDHTGNSGNLLHFTSSIHTLYVAYVITDPEQEVGFGFGPALNFYSLTSTINSSTEKSKKNYLLPGGMITGYWNFVSKRSWFIGARTDLILTVPARIAEINIVNASDPNSQSTFKATKAGSFSGSFGFIAGIRF